MKKKIQWISLVLCLVILLGVYWYINRPEPEPEPTETVVDLSFWKLTEDDIVRLRLISDQEIVLAKNDNQWQVVGLDPELVDQSQVTTVIRRFISLTATDKFQVDSANLGNYGLAQPRVTIQAELKDGSIKTVYLGDRHPTAYLYYVMAEGDPAVYTVNGMYGVAFEYKYANFRKRDLALIDMANLQHLYMRSSDKDPVEIVVNSNPSPYLKGMDRLLIVQPYETPLRLANVANYSEYTLDGSSTLTLRVKDYIDLHPEDLAQYGLDQPQGELLVADQNTSIHLLFGNDRNDLEVYAMLAGGHEVFSIYKNLIKIRNIDPFTWLNKFVYVAIIDEISGVDVAWDDVYHELRIEREEVVEEGDNPQTKIVNTFYIDGQQAKEQPFRRIYGTLIGLPVDAIIDQVPNTEPILKIVYHHVDTSKEPFVVEFLPYNRDLYAARIQGVCEFVISREKVDQAVKSIPELIITATATE